MRVAAQRQLICFCCFHQDRETSNGKHALSQMDLFLAEVHVFGYPEIRNIEVRPEASLEYIRLPMNFRVHILESLKGVRVLQVFCSDANLYPLIFVENVLWALLQATQSS